MGPASAIAVILVLVGLGLALLLRRLGGGSATRASWKGPDMATTRAAPGPDRRPQAPRRQRPAAAAAALRT